MTFEQREGYSGDMGNENPAEAGLSPRQQIEEIIDR